MRGGQGPSPIPLAVNIIMSKSTGLATNETNNINLIMSTTNLSRIIASDDSSTVTLNRSLCPCCNETLQSSELPDGICEDCLNEIDKQATLADSFRISKSHTFNPDGPRAYCNQ